jgi:hypothetical protein
MTRFGKPVILEWFRHLAIDLVHTFSISIYKHFYIIEYTNRHNDEVWLWMCLQLPILKPRNKTQSPRGFRQYEWNDRTGNPRLCCFIDCWTTLQQWYTMNSITGWWTPFFRQKYPPFTPFSWIVNHFHAHIKVQLIQMFKCSWNIILHAMIFIADMDYVHPWKLDSSLVKYYMPFITCYKPSKTGH